MGKHHTKEDDDEWSLFSCPNSDCKDHGARGQGNIRLKQRYGKNNVAELICRTCGKTFSENRGTPFFRLRLPYEKLYRILTSLVRCGSIRGTADVVGMNKNTVERVVKLAGRQMKGFNDFMLRNLKLTQAQYDEFWTYVKSKKGARMSSMALTKMRSVMMMTRREIAGRSTSRWSRPRRRGSGSRSTSEEERRATGLQQSTTLTHGSTTPTPSR